MQANKVAPKKPRFWKNKNGFGEVVAKTVYFLLSGR